MIAVGESPLKGNGDRAPQLAMLITAATPAGTQKAALTNPHGVKCIGLHSSTSHEVTKHLPADERRGGQQRGHRGGACGAWGHGEFRFKPYRPEDGSRTRGECRRASELNSRELSCTHQNDLYVWYAKGCTFAFTTLGCLMGIPKEPKQRQAPATNNQPLVVSLIASMIQGVV